MVEFGWTSSPRVLPLAGEKNSLTLISQSRSGAPVNSAGIEAFTSQVWLTT